MSDSCALPVSPPRAEGVVTKSEQSGAQERGGVRGGVGGGVGGEAR